jgi:HlyD family secretion protein
MSPENQDSIRVPWPGRFRHVMQRLLPAAVWCVAVVIVCILAYRENGRAATISGVAEARETLIASVNDGIISGVSVDLYDPVAAGQVVAIMDDTLLRAELAIAESELKHLKAELNAQTVLLKQPASSHDDMRRFFADADNARLDWLDRIVEQQADRIDLARLEMLMEHKREMYEKGILDELTWRESDLEYQELKTRINENDAAIQAAEALRDTTEQRLREFLASMTPEHVEEQLQPFREAISVQEARILEIADRRRQQVLQSPIQGKVARILHHAGESVRRGDPVLTVIPEQANRVVAWLDENQTRDLEAGASVEIHGAAADTILTAEVLRLSPRVEAIPEQAAPDTLRTYWGRAAVIGKLAGTSTILPGDRVEIRSAGRQFRGGPDTS